MGTVLQVYYTFCITNKMFKSVQNYVQNVDNSLKNRGFELLKLKSTMFKTFSEEKNCILKVVHK